MPITLGVAGSTIVPTAAAVPDIPVTTMDLALETLAVTTVLDTPAIVMPPTLTTPAQKLKF